MCPSAFSLGAWFLPSLYWWKLGYGILSNLDTGPSLSFHISGRPFQSGGHPPVFLHVSLSQFSNSPLLFYFLPASSRSLLEFSKDNFIFIVFSFLITTE